MGLTFGADPFITHPFLSGRPAAQRAFVLCFTFLYTSQICSWFSHAASGSAATREFWANRAALRSEVRPADEPGEHASRARPPPHLLLPAA